MDTTYNLLIDGMTDTIHCISVTEAVAWGMIKAKYEALDQEEVWIYLEESYGMSSIDYLRRSEYYFSIADNGMIIESLSIIKSRFDRCINGIKEG
jgi:hypothetical protein